MKHVLLLRAPTEDGPDRYEAMFEASGYMPLSVPVLETTFVHVDVLKDKIVQGPEAQGLSGVILTSKRAVEAWRHAIQSIRSGTDQADWRRVPFYVVGDATAAAAKQISTACPHLAPAESQVRGSTEAGTSERLAEFILGEGCRGQRLFYLTGDKNRETLPGMLTAGGVLLDTLDVYATTGSSTFRDDLRAVLDRAPIGESHMSRGVCAPHFLADDDGQWGWVVYFAPSVAAFVAPILSDVFQDALKVAAIGPTTASFLRDTLKMRVDVVTSKPTPDALARAVVAFDDAVASTL